MRTSRGTSSEIDEPRVATNALKKERVRYVRVRVHERERERVLSVKFERKRER